MRIAILLLLVFYSCDEKNIDDTSQLKASMNLVFQDEFEKSILDTTKWNCYTKSPKPYDKILPRGNCNFENAALLQKRNVVVANGYLNLIAKNEPISYLGKVDANQGKDLGCDLVGQSEFEFNLSFTSASIFSKKGYNLGYFECRAKIPCARGLYPVFWLWHHDEIVVFEFFGNSAEHFVSSHNKEKYVTTKFSKADYCQDFHVYSVEITWYFDHQEIWKICRDELQNEEISNYLPAPINDTYNISESLPDTKDRWLSPNISLRIYEWSREIDTEALPDTLVIDYINIYQNESTD